MNPRILQSGLCLLFFAGCGHMEIDSAHLTDANRTVTGTVSIGELDSLPSDASVSIRVLDASQRAYKSPSSVLGGQSSTAPVSLPPQVLGEATIKQPGPPPVPFTVRFSATDEQLAAGLILEARVSFGGRVRYFNVNSYAINSGNLSDPRQVYVNPVR